MPSRSRNRTTLTEEDILDFFGCERCSFRDAPMACTKIRRERGFNAHIPNVGCGKLEE